MAVPVDEAVLKALSGNIDDSIKLPGPYIIKIYIASIKKEFQEERRLLLEYIGPELQSLYDDRQIEVEFVDMHFGTGDVGDLVDTNPWILQDYLTEIDICRQNSKSIYFISLIGTNLGQLYIPTTITKNIYDLILNAVERNDAALLSDCYSFDQNINQFILSNKFLSSSSSNVGNLRRIIAKGIHSIIHNSNEKMNETQLDMINQTPLEIQIKRAIDNPSEKVISIYREWSDKSTTVNDEEKKFIELKALLESRLTSRNLMKFKCDGVPTTTLDPENELHDNYLCDFKRTMLIKLQEIIDKDLSNDPDCIKGRKKTVQEIFNEHSSHLLLLRQYLNAANHNNSLVEHLKSVISQNYKTNTKHAPYFITGDSGTGKSTAISQIYNESGSWFSRNCKIHRIIRFAGATSKSAYNLELLRVICQQISIIFNIPEGYLPKDASFDPHYIYNWFTNLLKKCEEMPNEVLVIIIDDLHKLHTFDCDIASPLSWLPISLPSNVYIIAASSVPVNSLRLSPVQKERFRAIEDCTYNLPSDLSPSVNQKLNYKTTFESFLLAEFEELERIYGVNGVSKLATYITCSEYGLSETELLELLMPTQNSDCLIETENGEFNFINFRSVRTKMKFLIREKLMSGKLLIEWRHSLCAEISQKRYMTPDSTRRAHVELANIFFNHEIDEYDDTSSNKTQNSEQPVPADEFGTQLNLLDISYSIRHVEEAWHHLMKSDDTNKFKQIAVCNFDFLLAAVQTVSISYLRCLIEHVRCYLLDRDVELIYYTIRKSSDVLTRDPMQLGAQLISWLRPISEHHDEDNSLLSITVRSATAWCDGYTVPLLVPLVGWLPPPLPSQIRTMTVSGPSPIRGIALTPSKQHLVIAPNSGDVQLWHIMSNNLVHTFKGHAAAVRSMHVNDEENILITGSDDSTVIVWDLNTRTMKFQLSDHKGPVLSVACSIKHMIVLSGGEDSMIHVSSLKSGKLVKRIEYHKNPVSSIIVNYENEVFLTSSFDASVILWSLDNFSLLKVIQFNSAILNVQITKDSVFLLVHCKDNGLYLRTLATGTELHCLKGHKSQVRTIATAMDCQRAVVGCDDTKAIIYDILTGRIIRILPPNPGAVTALHIMENDDFLITAGGNKITFYSFRTEEPMSNIKLKKSKKLKQICYQHTQLNLMPITCFDLSRDSQMYAIASGKTVQLWLTTTSECQSTFDTENSTITCMQFAPNVEFIVIGVEDKFLIVWSMSLSNIITTFKGHNSSISNVSVMMDSRRVVSADCDGLLSVWLADSGTLLQTVQGPHKHLAVTNNMKFAACTNGDTTLKIWSLTREDEKYLVSHSDVITCFAITADSLYVVTGSKDMSLKVWQATGGKLAQVLVGHSHAVTCVAVSVTNKTQVISGSKDTNLIIWDIHTGDEIHTLAGHLAQVTGVKISADGTTAVSGSDDKTLIVWETKRGLALTSLQIHVPFIRFDISLECSRILVQIEESTILPVICLHNTPASYIKLPTYSAPARDAEDLRPAGPKRQMKRLLKKEVSLDTYTWQKKYGHLTSSVMMAQVDERLKRRFSVSASMEEISKIAEMKTIQSQTNIGPEQAALAQSQHFDQLEALWNKRSPPRRRHNTVNKSSFIEDRIDSSDEDEFQEERGDLGG